METPILTELLQRTKALRSLARELVGDSHADDLLQDAAIQTMTAPPRRAGPAGGWLASVVRHLAGKHRRAERTRHRHEARAARAEPALPDRSAEDADTLRHLTAIVTSLPEPYRGTILARFLREQTPSEIADATGTPVATVKTRLQRGLALLRDRLASHREDWRGLLATAFALQPRRAPTLSAGAGNVWKVAVLVAVVLPVGLWFWSQEQPGGDTAETVTAVSGPGPAAQVPSPLPASDRSGALSARRGASDDDPGHPAPAGRAHPTTAGTTPASVAGAGTPLPEGPASHRPWSPPLQQPLMRLEVAGPAAFRTAFAGTNLGKLLGSEEGQRLWRPMLAPAERIWRQWDHGDDFDATRRRVLDYTGRIRVLWLVEPGEDKQRDRVFGVFALETDGATDLTALAGDLARTMQAVIATEPSEATVADHRLRLLDGPGGGFVTIPMVIEGSLVAFFGDADALDESVPRSLRALAMDERRSPAPLSLEIDLTQLRHLAGMRSEPPLIRAFGLESLRTFRATLRPAGPHVQLEMEVVFGPGERGGIAAFLPAVSTLPGLLARVPTEATPWLAVPFRPDLLFDAGEVATAEYHRLGAEDVQSDLRQELYEQLGLYLDTELLDHLGGEIVILGDLWQQGDPETFREGGDPPLGACIAMSLKDTAAFRRGFDKLLAHLRGVVHRYETRRVDGVEITRIGTMFLTGMHLAVGQDLVALGFGEEGVAQLEALVAGGRRPERQPLPPAIQHVQNLAPPGWNGLGLASLRALFGGQVALVIEFLGEALPAEMTSDLSVDATQEVLDRLLPLVTRHQLDNLVTMTGYDNGHWRLRLIW